MLLYRWEKERHYNGCNKTEWELNVSGCYRLWLRQPRDNGGSADPAVMICNTFGAFSALLAAECLNAARQHQQAEHLKGQGEGK